MRTFVLIAAAAVTVSALASGCGAKHREGARTRTQPPPPAPHRQHCARSLRPLGSSSLAYVGVADDGAVAYRSPGRAVLARFGRLNVNGYPTMFGVIGVVPAPNCKPAWYRVQLPRKPNGSTGYVRASSLDVQPVRARIDVDLSSRTLTLFHGGRAVLRATVAVGSPATPTPTGRYYVNQRLIPEDKGGPFGPAAIGISAFSTVLTGWAQGGPIAIHGTNEPWSIGHAVSNGCVRLPNATLEKLFGEAVAGTPVIIHV
jgi:lipoprotein-anchoring transpeptidase ErfK/SrfK